MSTPTPPAPQPTGSSRPWVLVVDDEQSMRLIIETVLVAQGWAVVCADGAEAALEALRARQGPPTVVICDVLMPGLDGLELVRRMCSRIPDLRVIFISGRLTDVSWWPEDLREKRFLAKPFEHAHLVAAVRAAMVGETHR